ncbi:MAG: copper resistance CopC family protein [Candidatus Limnocylindria bacterium]
MRIPRSRALLAGVAAMILAAAPAAAIAHVHLVSSSPMAGASLDDAPDQVRIEFDGELDPDHSSFVVEDADGGAVGDGEVDLGVADRNVLAGAVTITQPGVYTVTYEVLGLDGHEIVGSFSFGFDTDAEIPDPTDSEGDDHDAPDTAMRPDPGSPATTAGILLLLLAGTSVLRQLQVR